MEYKRETFFPKILCPIFESEISMLHLKLTEQEMEMLYLYVSLEMELVEH